MKFLDLLQENFIHILFFLNPPDFVSLSLVSHDLKPIIDAVFCSGFFTIDLSNYHTKITNISVKFFQFAKKINLSLCSIDDNALQYLSNAIEINISYCNKIAGFGFKYLFNVKYLNINHCGVLSSIIFDKLPSLEEISCWSVSNLSNNNLYHLSHVKKITLGFNNFITDEGIKHLKNVPDITIHFCFGITQEGLDVLKDVPKLNLYGLHQIKGCKCTACIKKID